MCDYDEAIRFRPYLYRTRHVLRAFNHMEESRGKTLPQARSSLFGNGPAPPHSLFATRYSLLAIR